MRGYKPSVVFMGSKPGAAVALSIILDKGWDVKNVVVSSTLRHPWIKGPSVEDIAFKNGINVVNQASLNTEDKVDYVISYMYRHLVKPETISMARRAALNFHPGPLPEFAGWAFYNLAILENAKEYGCTCHYMDDGFDTGPILKVRRFKVDTSRETACSLERQTQGEMIRLFREFCEMVEQGAELPIEHQDMCKFRYLKQNEFELLKEIPLDSDEETIDRVARAFWYPPYICAYLKLDSKKIEVVPNIVKEQLATMIHMDDWEYLNKFRK
ncbi:MAG: formyltransferase family protein [Negativicutes bacterium]|nr:formyltransferase family protein [Negativicutes bacterium]